MRTKQDKGFGEKKFFSDRRVCFGRGTHFGRLSDFGHHAMPPPKWDRVDFRCAYVGFHLGHYSTQTDVPFGHKGLRYRHDLAVFGPTVYGTIEFLEYGAKRRYDRFADETAC
jgi:hypothetical protein